MVLGNDDCQPDNSCCGSVNLFSVFVMEYLISIDSSGKNDVCFWKYVARMYVLKFLTGMI